MHVNLAGAGPVFGSPCGCDISEKSRRPPFWDLPQTRSTHHKPREERGWELHRLRLTLYDRAHSSRETRGLARNATRCRVPSFIVLGVVWGNWFGVGPWQLSSPRTSKSTLALFRIGSCFEWIAFSSALPQTRDNRRSTRTGDIAGKVVECVSISNAPLFSLLLYLYQQLAAQCQVAHC